MKLQDIEFPIFAVPKESIRIEDGLVRYGHKIIDDRNIDKETLGLRRLHTPFQKELFRLKYIVWDIQGLVVSKRRKFIDSLGKIFEYKKTRYCTLKFLRIEKVELKDDRTLLKIKGIQQKFEVKRPPDPGYEWAGILHVKGFPWLLYGYSQEKLKDTRRMV